MPPRPLSLCLVAWTLVAAVALGALPAGAQERFAVLIGANAGWANDKPLRYAETDAERLREVLVELGGFAPDRAVLLRDPDTATVRAQFQQLHATLRTLGRPSLVLVYYSGHADERHLHLRGAPLSHQELYSLVQALPATVKVGVLDACRSGSILAAKGGRASTRFQLQVVDELAVRGLALLTSSGADELSQETRALAGSVFTHHLVSGLRGAADGDGSDSVSLSEVYQHAYQRTVTDTAATAAPHRPAFRVQAEGQGELVLTRLERASARLVLPAAEVARYVVVDEHELRLVAEGQGLADRAQVLALAEGRYRLKRLRDATLLEVAELVLAPGQHEEASALTFVARPLEAGLLKGEPERMDAEERHQWRRSEALRLLAAGEAGPALKLLEALLVERPGEPGALRGRARALLRLAEVYERVGDHPRKRESLLAALGADPSLEDDPDFASWRQQLSEARRPRVEKPASPPLRSTLGASLGFEAVGPRGHQVLVGSVYARERWNLSLGVDLKGPGLDLSVRYLTPEWLLGASDTLGPRLRLFAGLGYHGDYSGLGSLSRDDTPVAAGLSYRQLYGDTPHLDAGLRVGLGRGPYLEVGGGLLLVKTRDTHRGVGLLSLGAGWHFR